MTGQPAENVMPIVPLGTNGTTKINLNLARLLEGRCIIQGSSGAGKSRTLRRIIEEAFDYVTTMIVDPEGESPRTSGRRRCSAPR